MILAVAVMFWVILSSSVLNLIAYIFTEYGDKFPLWGKVLAIVWNVWLVFVMLISLGII